MHVDIYRHDYVLLNKLMLFLQISFFICFKYISLITIKQNMFTILEDSLIYFVVNFLKQIWLFIKDDWNILKWLQETRRIF